MTKFTANVILNPDTTLPDFVAVVDRLTNYGFSVDTPFDNALIVQGDADDIDGFFADLDAARLPASATIDDYGVAA